MLAALSFNEPLEVLLCGLLRYKDPGLHMNGESSMAVVQADDLLEDRSRIESRSLILLESRPHGPPSRSMTDMAAWRLLAASFHLCHNPLNKFF